MLRSISAAVSLLSIVVTSAESFAQTNECAIFLQKPVFTSTIINVSQNSKEDFRLLQCSATWSSAQEAKSAGIGAEIPVYDIPIPIEANWSDASVSQWKSTHCTAAERSSDYAGRLYRSVYAVDPISAKAALECYRSSFAAAEAKALRCRLTETANALLFEAEWRRTPGETDNPPKVTTLTTLNTVCQNAGELAPNKVVPEGGVAILCSVQKDAAAFSLNTNRGRCVATAAVRLPKIVLPMNLELTQPMFIAGQDVEIPSGATLVTNGFPFTIRADRLTVASSRIIAFTPAEVAAQKPGRYAGAISITAKEVVGQGVTILNAGEPGGVGLPGPKGSPGSQGGPGSGRSPLFRQCGPLQFACDAILLGCTGGAGGGTGGQGGAGYPGNPGAPGGGAGEVTIDVPIEARTAFAVLVDVNIAGQPQVCGGAICGGIGGTGGPGGPGGDGGPGGPGAPGTTWCGGTGPGAPGPQGPQGPSGTTGPNGPNALVKVQ